MCFFRGCFFLLHCYLPKFITRKSSISLETNKMNFKMSSKMHKEQNPFVFSLLLNFPQKQDYHKQNRHTCIQILLALPRNSRLLIPSPDNYISSLLRQIMAQIVTQNSGSVGRKMCNLPPQAAPGETAIMGFLATPSTTGDAHWRSDHGEMHNFLPILFLPTPLPGPCAEHEGFL